MNYEICLKTRNSKQIQKYALKSDQKYQKIKYLLNKILKKNLFFY